MKAMNINKSDKTGNENLQFRNPWIKDDIKIADYHEMPEKGQIIISLYSQLFSANRINIFIRGDKIVLFITEQVKTEQPTAYVSDWQSFYPRSYLRMRNVSLLLPGDNFFLLRHYLIPEEFMLKIILGRATEN